MGGGSNRHSYFIPKKITTSEFVYPKKSLLFLTYPKKSLHFFSRPKKIPASFIDPKNHLWPKFQTQKNYSDTPIIKICEWGLWGYNTVYTGSYVLYIVLECLLFSSLSFTSLHSLYHIFGSFLCKQLVKLLEIIVDN